MKRGLLIVVSMVSLGLALSLTRVTAAQMHRDRMTDPAAEQTGQFQRIEHPLWARLVVTGAGLSLIGLELWWFVLSQPKAR